MTAQRFGGFQADEAPADNHRLGAVLRQGRQGHSIVYRAQSVNHGQFQSRDVRAGTAGPGAQNQSVVSQGFASRRTLYGDGFFRRVQADYLGVHPHIQVQFIPQRLWCIQQQALFRGDFPAQVKRQSAVRKGRIRPLFENNDFVGFTQASGARGERQSPGYPSNHYQSHVSLL